MPSPSEIERAFARALREPASPPPAGLVGRADETPARRFDVYRNNVHVSLIDVLAARYPVIERLVGTAFFREMARAFVATGLPRSPVLIEYGRGFGDFVDAFEPVRGLPWLGDVARLEWAWHEAYHAADAEPAEAGLLATIAPERLPDTELALHPSLRLIRSRWPVLGIWWTNRQDETVSPVDLGAGGDDLLLLRPRWEVRVQQLPPGGATFVAALAAGDTLGSAADRAVDDDGGFDLSACLRDLVAAGGVTGLRNGERHASSRRAGHRP